MCESVSSALKQPRGHCGTPVTIYLFPVRLCESGTPGLHTFWRHTYYRYRTNYANLWSTFSHERGREGSWRRDLMFARMNDWVMEPCSAHARPTPPQHSDLYRKKRSWNSHVGRASSCCCHHYAMRRESERRLNSVYWAWECKKCFRMAEVRRL